ncbi:SDR family NAD(P)-dependent oxidoreductase, partial [Streptomyces flavovirens]
RSTPLLADLMSLDAMERMVDEARETAGRVVLVVASAGIGWAGPFLSMPAAAVARVLTVDLASVVHLVRLLLPHMVAAG